jgi:hypothetical protein
LSETNVADCVSKPAGTGPPAGPLELPAVVVGTSVVGAAVVGATVVGAADVGAVAGAVVVAGAAVVGAAFWPPDPPQPAPIRTTTLSKTIHLTCRDITEIYPAAAIRSALRSGASEPGDGRKNLAADGLELTLQVQGKAPVHELAAALSEMDEVEAVLVDDANALEE